MKPRAIVFSLLALAACTEEPLTGAGLYSDYCASCHGADAAGGAVEVGGKLPPNLTTLSRRHGGTFPSVYVMSTIDGYAREATHGPMPIFGELIDSEIETWTDPEGVPTPTPVSLILLAAYLEGLQEG